MKEERLEILNMLRDGIISVEEAEKLISALDEGRGKTGGDERKENHSRGSFKHKSGFFEDFDRGFAGFGKAMGDLFGGFADMGRFHDFEHVKRNSDSIAPDEGDRLDISQQGRGIFRSGSDLTLLPSSDGEIHVGSEDDAYEVMRKDHKIALLCSGDTSVSIPEKIESVSVHIFNGDMSASDLSIPVNLETFNGQISVTGCGEIGYVKTVSGSIQVRLPEASRGLSEIQTVSGHINLLLPGDFNGIVETATISGEILCPSEDNIERVGIPGDIQSGMEFRFGNGDDGRRISCKTVSGDVVIEYADPE